MSKLKLSKKQKEELEKFGANTWYVEYLYDQFAENPESVPEMWKKFFGGVPEETLNKVKDDGKNGSIFCNMIIEYPQPGEGDESRIIVGSAHRVLDNMNTSLSIPVATSQRSIPVKLLEENRILINHHLQRTNLGKISFTHIISWAIVKAVSKIPVMNNAFSLINNKPQIIRRSNINLGLAIDIEKKDGSRSLLVPNIKKVNKLNFLKFWKSYEELIVRTREGTIDPAEFLGTTITLTNPGTIGTVASVPRLMVGQGAIIAIGAIQYNSEYQAMSPSTISALGVSKVMNITSTYDHRIIQGAESGLFLKEINDILLGKDEFYEEIFESLSVPMKPIAWQTDYQPGIFEATSNTEEIEKQAKVLQLINLYRVRGHLVADLDPLSSQIHYHPELDPSSFKFTMWDLDRKFITGGLGGVQTATLRQILEILQKTYCDKIGIEYMHIQNPEEKKWLQEKMEPIKNLPNYSKSIKKRILEKLIIAESFEHFIHNRFIGHKRFSLEGSETLLPLLNLIFEKACAKDILEVVIGMAHRGRLNVLANVIGKPFDAILTEFEDILDPDSIEGSGDVKYHLGASGTYKTAKGDEVIVSVASNPSHLEWVNPVVEGIVRAKQTRMGDETHSKVMPLLLHGDAAFSGQGVVAETLNLSQLSGFRTGGTVHIIINNQIGFTTTPEDARSSTYATDVAKMIQAPIFHVNGDDPEASLWATELAFDFREKFNKDVVVDLFGYRRHGHNEGDEPGFTQPLLYEKIKNHPSVCSLYTNKLLQDGVLAEKELNKIKNDFQSVLNSSFERIEQKSKLNTFEGDVPLAITKEEIEEITPEKDTTISNEQLIKIVEGLTYVPDTFLFHPKLNKFLEKRRNLLDDTDKADWALAESIAFGSLLLEGTPVRLSGQDSVRGTFSQRHLALTDINTGYERIPLNHLDNKQAKLEALDSFLSEAAVLGFEYGYSSADPLALVMWEAQFGDFANSAQVIIDNFIVVSNEKWGVPNNLVMLLPHGYEGQGPEHSSARLERFLILSAENNLQVCNVTTPAQYFHLLRRQIKKAVHTPLVIMTPKSLLRHPEAKSSKSEFIKGKFNEVIDDPGIVNRNSIKNIVLTSGKVYYDLNKYRTDQKIEDVAIIRIEQYYPYPSKQLKRVLKNYSSLGKIVWIQEEPKNMGAWNFLLPLIKNDVEGDLEITYVGRPQSASPAVGSSKISTQQQKELIKKAFK
jgi:2-oxoglutarate dehydrogenase E1 component